MDRDLFNVWHRWFGTGWPEEHDLSAIDDDLRAILDKHKAWPGSSPDAREAHPATMIGRR